MTIITRAAVREAYDRALNLHNDPDLALQAVAQAMALPVEAVEDALSEVVA